MGLAVPARPPLRGLLGLNEVSLGAGCGLVARIVIRRIPQRQINSRTCRRIHIFARRFGAHPLSWLRHDYACRSAAVAMDDWTSESDLQRISSVCTSHEQMGIAMVRRCHSCGIVCKSLLLCGRLSLTTTLGLRLCTLWLVVQIYLRRPGSSNSPPREG